MEQDWRLLTFKEWHFQLSPEEKKPEKLSFLQYV